MAIAISLHSECTRAIAPSRALLLLALIAAGCAPPRADSGSADAAGHTGSSDAATLDASAASTCAPIAVSMTESSPRDLGSALVAALHDLGASGAHADYGGDFVSIQGINMTLDANDDEVVEVLLDIIASLPGTPFDRSELALDDYSVTDAPDLRQLIVRRSTVGGQPTHFQAPVFTAMAFAEADDTWRFASLTATPSVALASDADVALLTACTPEQSPADAQLVGTVFEGLRMVGCGIVGEYKYTLADNDYVEWREQTTWVALDGRNRQGGVPLRWAIARDATVQIHKSNYWPSIDEADCFCGGRAGYETVVDVVAAEVIRYTPGINCVVC